MTTKDEVANRLAQKHYELEDGLTQIYRVTGAVDVEIRPTEPIKLLEVNQNTVPSGILPIQFDAAPQSGIDYPALIIEVTPEEFQRIRNKDLSLPRGWTLGDEIPRQINGVPT